MSNLFDYSTTPASNNSSPPDGAPEGMAPSDVNNTIRQMMANEAGAFNCYTAGGSADAQTVTMSPALAAYSTQVRIAFIPVANNTGACTLNVNGLGATSIKMLDGTDPPADALNSSGVAVVQYNDTDFILLTPASKTIDPADLKVDSGTYTTSSISSGSSEQELITHNLGTDNVSLYFTATGDDATNFENWEAVGTVPGNESIKFVGGQLSGLGSTSGANPASGKVSFKIWNRHSSSQTFTCRYVITALD